MDQTLKKPTTMPPFLLFQKSSKFDQRHSPLKSSKSDPFRPESLLSHHHQSLLLQHNNLSSAKLVATPDKMEASRRLSTPWIHSPEYCFRPLVLEPVWIVAPPYYVCDQYHAFPSCWRPDYIRTHGVTNATGPDWMNSAPKAGAYWTVPVRRPPHLMIPSGRVDATTFSASPFSGNDRTMYRSNAGKHLKKRGKDVCKRHPRTCRHCQQSTCPGASTRRSQSFRCATCPKCLTQCLGRCDDSSPTVDDDESGGEQQQSS